MRSDHIGQRLVAAQDGDQLCHIHHRTAAKTHDKVWLRCHARRHRHRQIVTVGLWVNAVKHGNLPEQPNPVDMPCHRGLRQHENAPKSFALGPEADLRGAACTIFELARLKQAQG